jgi:hypothetical protein
MKRWLRRTGLVRTFLKVPELFIVPLFLAVCAVGVVATMAQHSPATKYEVEVYHCGHPTHARYFHFTDELKAYKFFNKSVVNQFIYPKTTFRVDLTKNKGKEIAHAPSHC